MTSDTFSLEKIVFPWGQNLPPKTVYLSSMSSKDRGTQDTILSKLYRVLTQGINSFEGLLLGEFTWCLSDGPIIILIDCEQFSETVACWLSLRAYQTVNKELDFLSYKKNKENNNSK